MADPAPIQAAKAVKTEALAYIAPHEVYTGGTLYEPGEAFFTAEPKGREWQLASDAEALRAMEKAEAAAAKARR